MPTEWFEAVAAPVSACIQEKAIERALGVSPTLLRRWGLSVSNGCVVHSTAGLASRHPHTMFSESVCERTDNQ